jgi:hypothetical protein
MTTPTRAQIPLKPVLSARPNAMIGNRAGMRQLTRQAVLLAGLLGACGSESPGQPVPPINTGGTGGVKGTGGSGSGGVSGGSGGSSNTGGAPGTGGAASGSGGAAGTGGSTGTGGSPPSDAAPADAPTAEVAAETGGTSDAPAVMRPDAMGAPCATGSGYNFTIRPFASQKGTFTVFFTATPSRAPTNSVIGLSGGMKYLHDDFSAIIRFADNGNLDVRNDTAYTTLTPIKYTVTDYHFRLVIDVPARKYSAYVSYEGKPEVLMGTNLGFRDSAPVSAELNYWGVEAIANHMMKVCNFLVVP